MPGRKRKAASKAESKAADAKQGSAADDSSKRAKKGSGNGKLTVEAIVSDSLAPLANQYWAPQGGAAGMDTRKPYDAEIVEVVYTNELQGKPVPNRRATMLDISDYLEGYLWPNFDGKQASRAHVMSIMMMVNEKFRNNDLNCWADSVFGVERDTLDAFFARCVALQPTAAPAAPAPTPTKGKGKKKKAKTKKKAVTEEGAEQREMSLEERACFLQFLINCFQSLEHEGVRANVLPLTSFALWRSVGNPTVLDKQLRDFPELKQPWAEADEDESGAAFFNGLLSHFLEVLVGELDAALATPATDENSYDADVIARIRYAERFVELLTDLVSQRDTRAFVAPLLQDIHVVSFCRVSSLHSVSSASQEGHAVSPLFARLTAQLARIMALETEISGSAAIVKAHSLDLEAFQRVCFAEFPERLRVLALSSCSRLEDPEVLADELAPLDSADLQTLAVALQLLPGPDSDSGLIASLVSSGRASSRAFLCELLCAFCRKPEQQLERARAIPVFPTELVLFEGLRAVNSASGERSLALPKLNLQFLTMHDYLLRNFELYRLESAYEIRSDVVKAATKLRPALDSGTTVFKGFSARAVPIRGFEVTSVQPSQVGQTKPSKVRATISVDLDRFKGGVRGQWERLEKYDVLFLLDVQGTAPSAEIEAQLTGDGGRSVNTRDATRESLGLRTVRGCEITEIIDGTGKILHERNPETGELYRGVGSSRKYNVLLDAAQYEADMQGVFEKKAHNVYTSFNVLMRRHGKENNFKCVLETVRDLMEADVRLPPWLHEQFLRSRGGPPADASEPVEVFETFVSEEHLVQALPDSAVVSWESERPQGPATFSVTLEEKAPVAAAAASKPKKGKKGKKKTTKESNAESASVVHAAARWHRKPIAVNVTRNSVPFTASQVGALSKGLRKGLTLILGPPGTGKTDVAVQMITELYHAHPDQRILIVTHGNQALNDVFEKLLYRDIPQSYLVRLGRGSDKLQTQHDYSRRGRVAHILQRRLDLLAEVTLLSTQTNVAPGAQYNCDSAKAFYLQHMLRLWEQFTLEVDQRQDTAVVDLFPFNQYFAGKVGEGEVFSGEREHDLDCARRYWAAIETIFKELREIQPFELLHGHRDRGDYVVAKYAKVVAMTCTHAAIKRQDLLKMGFTYDSVIMEESAQMLDVETLIPLCLQRQGPNEDSRLQRLVLIGDHNQLPPVVKNDSLRVFSRFDQSLFARLARGGVPLEHLDAQGRSRPALAALWNWRYAGLSDLPLVQVAPDANSSSAFARVNAGFAFSHQLVDVQDLNGAGESEPNPFFFQNLAEAEYVVQTFMYMRLLGYPASRIAILTTYNGQKALIDDVLKVRCGSFPQFGSPGAVSTVDKFQGQQADFVLLSLVRTKSVGHLRDIRRLVVAMSRARLGLYVFCRASLFLNCYELARAFGQLNRRSTKLTLMPREAAHAVVARAVDGEADPEASVAVIDVKHMGALVHNKANNRE
jgi:intron-binding protein aquarius